MRRLPTLIVLLATTLSIAACGGTGSQQSGQAPPQETQAPPTTQSAPRENTLEESAASEGAPAETEAAEEAQSSEDGGGTAILSVTTLEGEQVEVGGQGDVTALYFMAGW